MISYLRPAYRPRAHENSRKSNVPYVRQPHSLLDKARLRHTESTNAVYHEMILNSDDKDKPSNRQSIADAKCRERDKLGITEQSCSNRSKNIAEKLCSALCMMAVNPFIIKGEIDKKAFV